ncbi:MAG: aminoacyl-tRNA hydrolase [Deltaproteobacteria bacterium]|nr:aminoacyl-tRNA hydrolase [Deltaproteobacteria bacterium]
MVDLLIVGLGNPGSEYERQRHNIGFRIVEAFAETNQISLKRRAFGSIVGEGKIAERSILIMKPQTFMNLSGNAVGEACSFYKIAAEQIMVVHDDLDLECGRCKFSRGAGHGGHNGIRSLIERLGTKEFCRLRVGIGRPPNGQDAADYVLRPFAKEEEGLLIEVIARASQAIAEFAEHGLTFVQQKYH